MPPKVTFENIFEKFNIGKNHFGIFLANLINIFALFGDRWTRQKRDLNIFVSSQKKTKKISVERGEAQTVILRLRDRRNTVIWTDQSERGISDDTADWLEFQPIGI